MAFDATLQTVLDAPVNERAPSKEFDAGGRLGVLAGCGAIGALAGAATAMSLGLVPAIAAAAGVALVTAGAAYYAGRGFLDCADRNELTGAVLLGFHVIALVAWPIVLQVAPAYASGVLLAAVASVFLFAAIAHPSAGGVGRLALNALLLGIAASYHATYALMS